MVVTEGDYFGAPAQIAGSIIKLEVEDGEVSVLLKARGTTSEGVLKASTARPQQPFRCHICPKGCGKQTTGDYLLHAVKGRRLNPGGDEGWTSNLEGGEPEREEGDEMRGLRARADALANQPDERKKTRVAGDGTGGQESPKSEREESVPKKKKKKRAKKKEKDILDGRHASKALEKELKSLFAGTSLDPKERVRRRVLSRAQKFIASKKSKTSSGSEDSSDSSSPSTVEDFKGPESVFLEETKVKGVAQRFPGALTTEAITTMKRSLLTLSGEEMDDTAVRPIALLYFRSVLAKRSTGAQSRELLNLSAALDCLLRGKVAAAADILAQRLKAQEAVCHGTSWSIAQRMEILPGDTGGLAARTELQHARKEDFEEAKTRWQSQSASAYKGDGKSKGKGQQKGDREPWKKDDQPKDSKNQKGKGKEKR